MREHRRRLEYCTRELAIGGGSRRAGGGIGRWYTVNDPTTCEEIPVTAAVSEPTDQEVLDAGESMCNIPNRLARAKTGTRQSIQLGGEARGEDLRSNSNAPVALEHQPESSTSVDHPSVKCKNRNDSPQDKGGELTLGSPMKRTRMMREGGVAGQEACQPVVAATCPTLVHERRLSIT
ncbi:hypothetical protein GQ600_6076 [Phytophthora cactorum]|nr:hypothetical protein GQ600_6076 [Phytophthora cactorum]